MAADDVYEIVDKQSLYGQEVLNVYQYRQIAVFTTTEPNVATAFKNVWLEQIMPAIRLIQSGDVTHTNITVKNLFNAEDYASEDVNLPGTAEPSSVSSAPSFDAYSFTARGTGLAVKPGGKRIAGVLPGFCTDGVVTNGAYLGQLAALANAMKQTVTVGTIIQDPMFQPILVKRIRSGVAGAYEYRMPQNQSELVYANIVSTLLKILVSSQVSRKIGVGA